MDRREHEQAKGRLEEVTRRLREESLSDEERRNLEREGRRLARTVMSPWLPFRWRHRIAMLVIAAIGFWGLVEGHSYLLLTWLTLFIFSPRLVGKFLFTLGGLKEEDGPERSPQ